MDMTINVGDDAGVRTAWDERGDYVVQVNDYMSPEAAYRDGVTLWEVLGRLRVMATKRADQLENKSMAGGDFSTTDDAEFETLETLVGILTSQMETLGAFLRSAERSIGKEESNKLMQ